jgi:hypothetical protein
MSSLPIPPSFTAFRRALVKSRFCHRASLDCIASFQPGVSHRHDTAARRRPTDPDRSLTPPCTPSSSWSSPSETIWASTATLATVSFGATASSAKRKAMTRRTSNPANLCSTSLFVEPSAGQRDHLKA